MFSFSLRHFCRNVDDPRGGASSRVVRDRMIEALGLPRKALALKGLLLGAPPLDHAKGLKTEGGAYFRAATPAGQGLRFGPKTELSQRPDKAKPTPS